MLRNVLGVEIATFAKCTRSENCNFCEICPEWKLQQLRGLIRDENQKHKEIYSCGGGVADTFVSLLDSGV